MSDTTTAPKLKLLPPVAPAAPSSTTTPAPAAPTLKLLPQPPAATAPNPNWSKLFSVGNPADWMRVATSNLGSDLLTAMPEYGGDPNQPYSANLAAAHQKTQEAQNRLPPFGNFTANAAGFAPYTMLGGPIGEGLGPAFNYGAPVVRKVLGNVIANTIGGGTAAEVRGEDPAKGALAGGVSGVLAAPLGGAANWLTNKIATPLGQLTGLLSTPAKVAAETAAQSSADYGAAKQYQFDPRDVNMVRSATMNGLDPDQQANLSNAMKSRFAAHTDSINGLNTVNPSNIDGYQRGLFNAVKNQTDKVLASQVEDNLNNFMGYATPTSGQPVGDALLAIEQARQSGQRAIMGKQLPQVIQKVQTQGLNPAQWAQAQSEFYNSDPSNQNALLAIMRKGGGSGSLPSGYGMSHTAGDVAEMAAGLMGMPDAGLVTGAGVQLLKAPLTGMMKGIKQKSLIGDLYGLYPGTTGQTVASDITAPGAAINAGLGGVAASGYYPSSFPLDWQPNQQNQ